MKDGPSETTSIRNVSLSATLSIWNVNFIPLLKLIASLSATRSYSYVRSTRCLYEVPFRTIPRNNIHNTIIYRYFHDILFNGFSQVEFCSTILSLTSVVIYFYFATNNIYCQWWYATSWLKMRDAGESQGVIVSRLQWYRSFTSNPWSEATHRDYLGSINI